jgi:hypothetical protein
VSDRVLQLVDRSLSIYESCSWDPRAYIYHNFLTEEECDYFIQKAIDQGLTRSQVAAGKDGGISIDQPSDGAGIDCPDLT